MKPIKTERGQSLVELAISLLFMLYLLAGLVEFGIAFFQFIQLRDAAQEGALYGSMNPNDTAGIVARTRGSSSSPVDLTNTSLVTVTPTVIGSPCEGNGIQVVVSFDHRVFMPFVPQLIGRSTIPLVATVTDTILSPICSP